MANNTTLNAMTGGDVIADEDISGVKYQLMKLASGTAADTTRIGGETRGLWVVAHRDTQIIDVQSAGLTTAATAYTAGDQVGTQFTLANAARVSGEGGTIVGVELIDAADIIGAYDVVFYNSSVTVATDNAAFGVSDADVLKQVGIASLTAFDTGANRAAQCFNLAIPYICNGGTSLFAGLVCRVGHTFFGAVGNLQLKVLVERN